MEWLRYTCWPWRYSWTQKEWRLGALYIEVYTRIYIIFILCKRLDNKFQYLHSSAPIEGKWFSYGNKRWTRSLKCPTMASYDIPFSFSSNNIRRKWKNNAVLPTRKFNIPSRYTYLLFIPSVYRITYFVKISTLRWRCTNLFQIIPTYTSFLHTYVCIWMYILLSSLAK